MQAFDLLTDDEAEVPAQETPLSKPMRGERTTQSASHGAISPAALQTPKELLNTSQKIEVVKRDSEQNRPETEDSNDEPYLQLPGAKRQLTTAESVQQDAS